jgi:hypothetical protein
MRKGRVQREKKMEAKCYGVEQRQRSTYGLTITDVIDGDNTVTELGEKLDLVSPTIPVVGEPMHQEQRLTLGITSLDIV